MRRRSVLRSAERLPRPQRRVRRTSRGATLEWYGASLLVVITAGSIRVGLTDPQFVVGMGLLVITLGLLWLRARLAQPTPFSSPRKHGR